MSSETNNRINVRGVGEVVNAGGASVDGDMTSWDNRPSLSGWSPMGQGNTNRPSILNDQALNQVVEILFADEVHSLVNLYGHITAKGPARRRRIPNYPDMPAVIAEELYTTAYGLTKVYRLSQRGNEHRGWVDVRPIHLYGPAMFHDWCGNDFCEFCTELDDRRFLWICRRSDHIGSQFSNIFDQIPLDETNLSRATAMAFLVNDDDDFDESLPPLRYEQVSRVRTGVTDCVCLDETIPGDIVRMECGKTMHRSCFDTYISVRTESQESLSCPFCRRILQLPVAESGKVVFIEHAEYITDGEIEYSDPVNWRLFQKSDYLLQTYIFTGSVEVYSRVIIVGKILQVRDLADQKVLSMSTSSFELTGSGFEINIISEGSLEIVEEEIDKCSFVVEQPVVHMEKSIGRSFSTKTILIAGVGTYGDIRPLELIAEQMEFLGMNVVTSFPSQFQSTLPFDWYEIENEFRKQPTAIPGIGVIVHAEAIKVIFCKLKEYLEQHHVDYIISTPVFISLPSLAQWFGIPYVLYSAIPMKRGAFTFIEQNSQLMSDIATFVEKCVLWIAAVPRFYELPNASWNDNIYDTDDKYVYSVAPELFPLGEGNIILNHVEHRTFDYDIFYCLGSLADDKIDKYYLDVFHRMPEFKILMQTTKSTGCDNNVTFINRCNHEDVMRSVPVVICHGGSGTLQTALRFGCRVLVQPFWVDQRFWPSVCRSKGYAVDIAKQSQGQLINQIRNLVPQQGHSLYRITGRTPKHFASVILKKLLQQPQRQIDKDGVFIYSELVKDNRFLNVCGRIENMLFGDARCAHVGIGKITSTETVYYDLSVNPYGLTKSIGKGIDPRIQRLRYLKKNDIDYELLKSFIPTHYGVENCRTMIDRYLKATSEDFTLDIWHQQCKIVTANKYTGTHRAVESMSVINHTYMSDLVIPTGISNLFEKDPILTPLNPSVDPIRRCCLIKTKDIILEASKRVGLQCTTFDELKQSGCRIWFDGNIINPAGFPTVYLMDNGYYQVPVFSDLTRFDKIGTMTFMYYGKPIDVPLDSYVRLPTAAVNLAKIVPDALCTKKTVPCVNTQKILLQIIKFIGKYKLSWLQMASEGISSTIFIDRSAEKVIRISTSKTTSPLSIESIIIDGILIEIQPYLFDDGLPVVCRNIAVTDSITDLHRSNVRSSSGIGILIDQEESDTYYHHSLRDLIMVSGLVEENQGNGDCFFHSTDSISYRDDILKSAIELRDTFKLTGDTWDSDLGDAYALAYNKVTKKGIIIFDIDNGSIVIIGDTDFKTVVLSHSHYRKIRLK